MVAFLPAGLMAASSAAAVLLVQENAAREIRLHDQEEKEKNTETASAALPTVASLAGSREAF